MFTVLRTLIQGNCRAWKKFLMILDGTKIIVTYQANLKEVTTPKTFVKMPNVMMRKVRTNCIHTYVYMYYRL